MAQNSSTQQLDQLKIRLPDGLREQIKVAAKAAGRTMNAEIIYRISTWREPSAADPTPTAATTGKTLRDEFAMAALTGLLAAGGNSSGNVEINGKTYGYDVAAYLMADGMMKGRDQRAPDVEAMAERHLGAP